MKEKEKAKELFTKYYFLFPEKHRVDFGYKESKECALIAVNEIISSNPHSNPLNTEIYSTMEFWMQVKHEINQI
jgi:hypothetical protein